MFINILYDIDVKLYNHFIAFSSNKMIYHTYPFLTFLSYIVKGELFFFCAFDHSELIGVLPCISKKTSFGTVINSLPWYGSYGSITTSEEYDSRPVKTALIDAYNDFLQEQKVLSATLITQPFEKDIDIYNQNLSSNLSDSRNCQISQFPVDMNFDDFLMKSIKQKTRNLVRKSLKQGFSVSKNDSDLDWRYLFETHKANMLAIGAQHKPLEHFYNMREFLSAENRELYIASLDHNAVAALLLFYHKETVEYITPVISYEYRSKQPLSFLIWEAMKDAKRRNMKYWNWGGTWKTQESLYHFKSGWGANDFPYFYYITASDKMLNMHADDFKKLRGEVPFFYLMPY